MENYNKLITSVNRMIVTLSIFIGVILIGALVGLYVIAARWSQPPQLFITSLYSEDCYSVGGEPAMKYKVYFTDLEVCKDFLKLRDE